MFEYLPNIGGIARLLVQRPSQPPHPNPPLLSFQSEAECDVVTLHVTLKVKCGQMLGDLGIGHVVCPVIQARRRTLCFVVRLSRSMVPGSFQIAFSFFH